MGKPRQKSRSTRCTRNEKINKKLVFLFLFIGLFLEFYFSKVGKNEIKAVELS